MVRAARAESSPADERSNVRPCGGGVAVVGGRGARAVLVVFALVTMVTAALMAQENAPDARELLRRARINHISQSAELEARLRTRSGEIPFAIRLRDGRIEYQFSAPEETVTLVLRDDQSELTLRRGGRTVALGPKDSGVPLRDTLLSYDDLAMRFLYWPVARVIGEEIFRSRPAWRVELHPGTRASLYGAVRVLLDKASGALLRIEGYDWEGRLVRRFEVVSVQKIEGQFFLKSMRIEGFDPESRRVTGRIYLDVSAIKGGWERGSGKADSSLPQA